MRKLIATIAAAVALAGVGLATHSATSDTPADAAIIFDNAVGKGPPSAGFYWMEGVILNG